MATPVTPPINEALVHARLGDAVRGSKGALIDELCAATGRSRSTIYRAAREATIRPVRRKRSDAGDVALARDEALLISAMVMEGMRKNGKRLYTIDHAVTVLRANGAIRAERIDPVTGECKPLSGSAIARALRTYGLHPDQLLQPAPARELRSLHPNHVWQIDASLCVLYYLETTNPAEMGLQVMEAKKFNKNKPKNLKRVEDRRVWSYEVTDHNSGCLFATYVFDGESAANIAATFIAAIQQRGADPFYGVPFILMMDMGSANTSGLFKNLLRRLDVRAIPHAPENARATGQVENARNILERDFESGLRLKPVGSLDELNARVSRWLRWFNATKIHSRHGKARTDQWMTIQPEQLRIAPAPELCRELLTHTPVERKVSDKLRVDFKGAEYDVAGLPNVMVGEKVLVTYSPYQASAILVVGSDAEGEEVLHPAPLVAKGEDGFSLGAHSNVIGEDWRRHADTQADLHRKEVELLAMQASTLEEAAAKRKAKATAFGGRIDPEKHIVEATLEQAGVRLAIEQQRAIFEVARARGDERTAMQAQNEIRRLEILLLELTAQAKRAEAQAALASIEVKRAELIATGQLTDAKRLELDAARNAARAKEVEAKISEVTAQKMRNLASAHAEAARGARDNANATNESADAMDRLNEATDRFKSRDTRFVGMLQSDINQMIAQRYGEDMVGNAKAEEALNRNMELENYQKSYGDVRRSQESLNQERNIRAERDRLEREIEEQRSGKTTGTPTTSDHPQQQSTGSASGGATYVSNITIPGLVGNTPIRYADAASQRTGEDLLRRLAQAKGASI